MGMEEIYPDIADAKGHELIFNNGSKMTDTTSGKGEFILGYNNESFALVFESVSDTDNILDKYTSLLTENLPKVLNHLVFSENALQSLVLSTQIAVKYWELQGESKKTFICIGSKELFKKTAEQTGLEFEYLEYPDTILNDTSHYIKEDAIIDELEERLSTEEDKYAGIIVEPLVHIGENVLMSSEEFMQKLQWTHRQFDTLLIFDETNTGFGKTGDIFACQKTQVEPDIICLAKGLNNGFSSLSACAFSDAIHSVLSDKFQIPSYHPQNDEVKAGWVTLNMLLEKTDILSSLENNHIKYLAEMANQTQYSNFKLKGNMVAFDVVDNPAEFIRFMDSKGFAVEMKDKTVLLNTAITMPAENIAELYNALLNYKV